MIRLPVQHSFRTFRVVEAARSAFASAHNAGNDAAVVPFHRLRLLSITRLTLNAVATTAAAYDAATTEAAAAAVTVGIVVPITPPAAAAAAAAVAAAAERKRQKGFSRSEKLRGDGD